MNAQYKEMLKVGNSITLFQSWEFKNIDCATLFEPLQDDSGYLYTLYLKDMMDEEIDIIKNNELEFRYYKDKSGMVLGLMHFAGTSLYMEMQLDPTKYAAERSMQFLRTNNTIHFVAAESSNLEVKVKRECKIPLKLANAWANSWTQAYSNKNYSKEYWEWTTNVCGMYEIEELWEMAHKS